MFNFGKVTAQVDLEYLGERPEMTHTNVEQAFVIYDLGNGLPLLLVVTSQLLALKPRSQLVFTSIPQPTTLVS